MKSENPRQQTHLLVQLGVDHKLIILHGKHGQEFCVLEEREGEWNVTAILQLPLRPPITHNVMDFPHLWREGVGNHKLPALTVVHK